MKRLSLAIFVLTALSATVSAADLRQHDTTAFAFGYADATPLGGVDDGKHRLVAPGRVDSFRVAGSVSNGPARRGIETATMVADTGGGEAMDKQRAHVLADVLKDRGIASVVVAFAHSREAEAAAKTFAKAFRARNGEVAFSAPVVEGKPDYVAEVGALSTGGAEYLALFGCSAQAGTRIIQTALDTGAFSKFILGDRMVEAVAMSEIDGDLTGSIAIQADETGPAVSLMATTGAAGGTFHELEYRNGAFEPVRQLK